MKPERTKRRLMIPAAVLVTMLGLAGCSGSNDSASFAPTEESGYDSGAGIPDVSGERLVEGADGGQAELFAPGEETGPVEDGRQVIVTGTISITVDDPRDAADEATSIVEGAGGHIDSRVESAPRDDDRGRAELTVRIPADALTATLDAIEELGTVEDTNTQRQDVTTVARDLDARITALEASVDRLLALMVDATTTADLITIESALSQRQSDLESLQSQRRSIADQVDYSTVTLYLGSEADAPVDEPDTFLSGLTTGWEALVAFLSFLLVAFGVMLPWLVLPGVALLIVWLLVRRSRRAKGAATEPTAATSVEGDDRA
jgi:hypothetical protein